MSALIPELYVTDLGASLAFYAALGFTVTFERPAEGFARIERDCAAIMLEEPRGRVWLLGPLERPFGRGVNLQVAVADAAALADAAVAAGIPLLVPLESRSYARTGDVVHVRQFVVADPDGYLTRFSEVTGYGPKEDA